MSVGEVLRRREDLHPNHTHLELRVVTSALSTVLEMPLDEISISDVEANIPKVREYLVSIGMRMGKRNNYIAVLRELIRFGEEQPQLAFGPRNLVTLGDLMSFLPRNSSTSCYRTAARHACACLSRSADALPIDLLLTLSWDLTPYFMKIRLNRQTRNYNTHQIYKLIRFAKKLGWRAPSNPVRDAWNLVGQVLSSTSGRRVVEFATRKLIPPSEITESHLNRDFVAAYVGAGKTSVRAREICSSFKRDVVDAGIENAFPYVDFRRYQPWWIYYMPLDRFPEQSQLEIHRLRSWKLSPWEPERPEKARHREISAELLVQILCRVQGYVTTVLQQPPVETLEGLVSEALLTDYVRWFTTVRNNPGYLTHLRSDLGLLRAAVTHYPGLKKCDFGWFDELLKSIPSPGARELRRRRKLRSVRPELVEELLAKMKEMFDESIG